MIEEFTRFTRPRSEFLEGPFGHLPSPKPARYGWEVEADAIRELRAVGIDPLRLVTRLVCRTCWEAPALAGTTICRICGRDPVSA